MSSDEPQANEIGDVSPTSLSHLIGQKGVVEQVRVALEAAFAFGSAPAKRSDGDFDLAIAFSALAI